MSGYLEEKRKIYYESFRVNVKESNETLRTINTQLIFFATAIFSLSFIIFQNEQILKSLLFFDKIILILIWLSLGFSVYFGISQFFKDYEFFKKFTIFNSKMLVLLKDEKYLDIFKNKYNLINNKTDNNEELNNVFNEIALLMIEKRERDNLKIKNFSTSTKLFKLQAWSVYFSLVLIFIFFVTNFNLIAEIFNYFKVLFGQ